MQHTLYTTRKSIFVVKILPTQLTFDLLFKPCLKKFSSTAKNCWNGSWSSETISPRSSEVSIRFLMQSFKIFRRLVRSVFHSCSLLLSVVDKLLWCLVKVLDQPTSWSSSSPDTVAILFSFNAWWDTKWMSLPSKRLFQLPPGGGMLVVFFRGFREKSKLFYPNRIFRRAKTKRRIEVSFFRFPPALIKIIHNKAKQKKTKSKWK